MKKTILLFLITIYSLFFIGCLNPKISYNLSGMNEGNKQYYLKRLNSGKNLFKENCSNCHGIFTKGQKEIPNFSKEQYDNYEAAFLANDQKNHAVMNNISKDDLDKILLFLSLAKIEK